MFFFFHHFEPLLLFNWNLKAWISEMILEKINEALADFDDAAKKEYMEKAIKMQPANLD